METKQNSASVSLSKPIVIHRTFDLPVAKIWAAWTEPGTFKKWWGPKDFTCPKCEIDFKVGGKIHACMKDKSGKEYWSIGTYKEIIPNRKFVVTDSFSDEKGNTVPAEKMGMPGQWPEECLITVSVEEKDGKTVLNLKHEGIPSEAHNDCMEGWNQSLDKMKGV